MTPYIVLALLGQYEYNVQGLTCAKRGSYALIYRTVSVVHWGKVGSPVRTCDDIWVSRSLTTDARCLCNVKSYTHKLVC